MENESDCSKINSDVGLKSLVIESLSKEKKSELIVPSTFEKKISFSKDLGLLSWSIVNFEICWYV